MSALAKPFFASTTALNLQSNGQTAPINLDHVIGFQALDLKNTVNAANGITIDEFKIVFTTKNSVVDGPEVIWKYATAVLRDADLAAIDAIATNIL